MENKVMRIIAEISEVNEAKLEWSQNWWMIWKSIQ